MKSCFIFDKENRSNILFYSSVIPLFIYGLYKNGFILKQNNFISLFDIIKLFIYPFGCLGIAFLFKKIFKYNKNNIYKYAILFSLASPYNFNLIAYFSLVSCFLFLIIYVPNWLKINEVSFFMLIIIILNYVFNNSIIFNPMEITNRYYFTLIDLVFGRGASFIFTSSILLIFIAFIVLSFDKFYKKEVAIISFFTYLLFFFIAIFFSNSFVNILKVFLNSITIFNFVFIAPINESSPSRKNDLIIYSILIGVLSFAFVYILDIYTGSIIACFIVSVLYRIYEIIRHKKFLKNHLE